MAAGCPAARIEYRIRDHAFVKQFIILPEFGRGGVNNTLDFAAKLLSEAHVAVVPGEAFGTSSHIRISYATSMHELERGLDRIQKFIEAL